MPSHDGEAERFKLSTQRSAGSMHTLQAAKGRGKSDCEFSGRTMGSPGPIQALVWLHIVFQSCKDCAHLYPILTVPLDIFPSHPARGLGQQVFRHGWKISILQNQRQRPGEWASCLTVEADRQEAHHSLFKSIFIHMFMAHPNCIHLGIWRLCYIHCTCIPCLPLRPSLCSLLLPLGPLTILRAHLPVSCHLPIILPFK